MRVQISCPTCHGQCKVVSQACEVCQGSGFGEEEPVSIDFNFPKGVEDYRFVYRGQGNPSRNSGPPGNLYVSIKTKPHEFFERLSDGNILLKVPVSYTQLVLGAEIEVPTMEGKVSLKIPSGTVSGTKFRLKELGLPIFKNPGSMIYKDRGDQVVQTDLVVPKDITQEHMKILKKLEKLEKTCKTG